jgi:hypothetical protein
MLFNIIITSTLNNWKLQHIYFRSFFQEPDFFWTKLVNYRHVASYEPFEFTTRSRLLLFFWTRNFRVPENHDHHRPLEAQEYFTIWENYTLYCPCCHHWATMTTTRRQPCNHHNNQDHYATTTTTELLRLELPYRSLQPATTVLGLMMNVDSFSACWMDWWTSGSVAWG